MMTDLRSRAEELKMENEYQLRLKDMTFAEKVKEVTEKYTTEIDLLKKATASTKDQRNKEEAEHKERMQTSSAKWQKEIDVSICRFGGQPSLLIELKDDGRYAGT